MADQNLKKSFNLRKTQFPEIFEVMNSKLTSKFKNWNGGISVVDKIAKNGYDLHESLSEGFRDRWIRIKPVRKSIE